jgi:hypothetical protein
MSISENDIRLMVRRRINQVLSEATFPEIERKRLDAFDYTSGGAIGGSGPINQYVRVADTLVLSRGGKVMLDDTSAFGPDLATILPALDPRSNLIELIKRGSKSRTAAMIMPLLRMPEGSVTHDALAILVIGKLAGARVLDVNLGGIEATTVGQLADVLKLLIPGAKVDQNRPLDSDAAKQILAKVEKHFDTPTAFLKSLAYLSTHSIDEMGMAKPKADAAPASPAVDKRPTLPKKPSRINPEEEDIFADLQGQPDPDETWAAYVQKGPEYVEIRKLWRALKKAEGFDTYDNFDAYKDWWKTRWKNHFKYLPGKGDVADVKRDLLNALEAEIKLRGKE